MAQRGQQARVIALMQADAGLVQNVEHAHQSAANLGSQADALRLAARQRGRAAGQGQIIQAHVAQEAQPRVYFLQDGRGNHGLRLVQLKPRQERPRSADVHFGYLGNVLAAHGDCQRFLFQALAAAVRAGLIAHVFLIGSLHRVAAGIPIAALQRVHHALKGRHILAAAVDALIIDGDFLSLRTIEQDVHDLLGQLAHGGIHGKAVMRSQGAEQIIGHGAGSARIAPAHAADRPLIEGFIAIRNAQIRADFHQRTQARAGGARAIGIVEGEHARCQLLDVHAAVRAGVILRKLRFLAAFNLLHGDKPAALLECRFQAVGQALADIGAHHQAIHHDLDGVLFLLIQLGRFVQLVHFAVDAHAQKAVLERLLQQLGMLALAGTHDGREQLELGALGQRQDGGHHLIDALLADFAPAHRAMRRTRAGIQQAQVIVNLRHRAHGRARVAGGGFLINGNGRGQTLDQIDVGLIHLPQKLPGVGRHAFHIAALPLGVYGIKGQAALAGAGQAGKDDHAVARQGDADVFQVVLARTLYDDGIVHGRTSAVAVERVQL